MRALELYDYAVIRVVPRVERESRDWSSVVCSSELRVLLPAAPRPA